MVVVLISLHSQKIHYRDSANNLANICLLVVQCMPSRSDEQFHDRVVSCPDTHRKYYSLFAKSVLYCADSRLFVF